MNGVQLRGCCSPVACDQPCSWMLPTVCGMMPKMGWPRPACGALSLLGELFSSPIMGSTRLPADGGRSKSAPKSELRWIRIVVPFCNLCWPGLPKRWFSIVVQTVLPNKRATHHNDQKTEQPKHQTTRPPKNQTSTPATMQTTTPPKQPTAKQLESLIVKV